MELSSYFTDFLSAIRLTTNQASDARKGHRTLRERLLADADLKPIIVSTFLQGSYRRATAVRPRGDQRADVDVVVVTRLAMSEYDPNAALGTFIPFLDKHYEGKYEPQGRSFGIELSYVDLDLVITAAPSESEEGILTADSVKSDETLEEAVDLRFNTLWVPPARRSEPTALRLLERSKAEPEWKLSPLWIPDRDIEQWQETHPLEQMRWTREKNRRCNGHYINVVKAIKWWRRLNPTPKYPKGYPVEHLVGVWCPDGITSVADGVTRALEGIRDAYRQNAMLKQTPVIPDHGVPAHNVLGRVDGGDFAAFHGLVTIAAGIARRAYDADTVKASAETWRELFGPKFPPPPDDNKGTGGGPTQGGFTPRTQPSTITGGRFG